MAGARAKFTPEVGVCLYLMGPGAIHLLNRLYDARMDHQPVLAIVGQQAATAIGQRLPAVDLQSLFQGRFAYVETVVSPAQLLHVLDRALRVAVGERQVATVIVPNDVQQMAAPKRAPAPSTATVMSAVGFVQPRPYARDADLEAAAAILNRGRRVAILAGAGALGAHAHGNWASPSAWPPEWPRRSWARRRFPDDLPYVTSAPGLLGTRASSMLMGALRPHPADRRQHFP